MKIEIKWGYAAGFFRIKKSVPMKIGTESFRDTTLVLRPLLAWSALQRTIIRVPVNGGKPSVLTVFQQAPGGGFSFAGFCWLSPSVSSLGETGGKVLVPFMGFALFTWFEKDGVSIHCTRTVVNRIFEKVPKAQNENNVALAFDEVASANKEKIRELLQKKNIVYIYHNQVDARGDKPASENEVFTACSEAIEEIHKLIKKLTGYISAPKFFITADHGFLYKRDKLQEFDKVSYDREICAYSNKRFLLTTQEVREPGVKSRLMTYMNNLYVTTPIGADIFKVAGGGQNYVHGGSSLQEMLIPVIELTTNTRAVAYDYVDVILTSVNRKVTNLITYFDFIQTEKVTDTMKARSLVAYFTTEDGEKISFDVPIVANSREDAPEKRTFHEKFTLKSREYKYGDKYYLVLADANDEKNILQQYEFMIDIAFVDDFGF